MAEWRYGDSWEKYPIHDGETWTHTASGSAVTVHDIRDPLPGHLVGVDLLYCDPPWNQGNVNSFVTKAGLARYVKSYGEFLTPFFAAIDAIGPRVLYLEAGEREHLQVIEQLRARPRYRYLDQWGIRYYRKKPCILIRAATVFPAPCSFAGLDDEETPFAAIEAEAPTSVADLCTGRGLTLLAAHRCGLPFHGTELNKRRLAVALERAASVGIDYRPQP